MPYPDDDQFYSLCDSNDSLGELGEGFPLFFILIKYMTVILLVLTVVYFFPTVYFMVLAYQKVKDNVDGQDDSIGLISFGIFVKFSNKDGEKYVIFEDRERYIEIVTGLMMASIIVFIICSVYLRKRLLDKAVKVDTLANTPSDFTLMGYCPYFSENCNYSKVSIEREIKEWLNDEFQINEIEYVNVAYDIHDMYQITEQL